VNRVTLRVEIKRWLRTRRLLAVGSWFVFSGLVAPLLAKYSKLLLNNLAGQSNVKISIHAATWTDALHSYLKNASQISVVVVVFAAASTCTIGRIDSLGAFYRSRASNAAQVFLPRIGVATTMVAGCAIAGAACTLYETTVLFTGVDWVNALTALGVQVAALGLLAAVAAGIAAVTGSAVLATVATVGAYIISAVASSLPTVGDAMPAHALMPAAALGGDATPALRGLAVLAILAMASVAVALSRTVRHVALAGRRVT
jgi:hypothetical protein